MKFSEIMKRCRECKWVRIVSDKEGNKDQWLLLGGAAYPMYGMPWLTPEMLMSMMDVPERERNKYSVEEAERESITTISFADFTARESQEPLLRYPFRLSVGDGTYMPVETSRGVMFVNVDYLSPYKDELASFELYERRYGAEDEHIYFAVKIGLQIKGIVMPAIWCQSDEQATQMECMAASARRDVEAQKLAGHGA